MKDKDQLSFYISGIGTYGESDISRWWDAIVARSSGLSMMNMIPPLTLMILVHFRETY